MMVRLFLIVWLGMISSCGLAQEQAMVCDQQACVTTEVVRTPKDLQLGLGGRASLAEDHGMLFVFTKEDRHAFWMKGMQFSLDIIWLDAQGKIVTIEQNLTPCTPDACPSYAPSDKSLYVLEVNAHFTQNHHWQTGQQLEIKGLDK